MAKSRFKTTYILLGIFVILLLVVVFFENEGADKKRDQAGEKASFLTESQLNSVDKAVFSRSEHEDVIINKNESDDWVLSNYLVDPQEAEKFDESLINYSVGKLVSKKQENWEKYELTDEEVSKVVLFSGEVEIANLYFGKYGNSFRSVYTRRNDDHQVYLVNTSLNSFINYDVSRWRDKRLLPIEKDSIESFTIRLGEARWTVVKQGESWMFVTDTGSIAITESESVDTYLDDLISLRGNSIEDDMSLFETADNAIAVTVSGGSEYIVSIDSKSENEAYAQITNVAGLFKLSSSLSARLQPSFIPEAATVDEDAVEESGDVEGV